MTRAQANFVALGVALLLVTTALGVALTAAGGTLAAADAGTRDRAATAGLADRLVAADAPITARANVLNASAVAALDEARLRAAFPAARNRSVRVALDGETLVEVGEPTGPTVRRLVLVQRRDRLTVEPTLVANETVSLPPTATAVVNVSPRAGVTAVRANGRVVLRDERGLAGRFVLDLPRGRSSTLSVASDGVVPSGGLTITARPWETRQAVLEVTVDA